MRGRDLAAIFRERAEHVRWQGSNNDPESETTAREQAFDVLFEEYTSIAKMLEDESTLPDHKRNYLGNKEKQK